MKWIKKFTDKFNFYNIKKFCSRKTYDKLMERISDLETIHFYLIEKHKKLKKRVIIIEKKIIGPIHITEPTFKRLLDELYEIIDINSVIKEIETRISQNNESGLKQTIGDLIVSKHLHWDEIISLKEYVYKVKIK